MAALGKKRMHPLKMVQSLLSLIQNTFIIFLLLFVFSEGKSTINQYARWAFLLLIMIRLVGIMLEWWNNKYELKENAIHITRGVFKKKSNSIPLDKVQNVQTSTPWYFKPFSATSLILVTSATDEDASVKLEAVKKEEAARIENQVLTNRRYPDQVQVESGDASAEEDTAGDSNITEEWFETRQTESSEKTVHFRPTKKDLFKASFLSLSFLAFIPIILTLFQQVENVINWEAYAEEVYILIVGSWVFLSLSIGLLIIIAVGIGVARTFLKYGKYEIASDKERIYIKRGTWSEQSFSIRKENVQGIQFSQNPLKKWLNLTEVKLISAVSGDDENSEINTLYPFLPTDQAFQLLEELLPMYQVTAEMSRLPKEALYVKLLRLPLVWGFITLILWIWQPSFLGFDKLFIYLSIFLGIWTYMMRMLRYKNARYTLNQDYIQFQVGGLWSNLFITKRKKVIEIAVEQSFLQRKFGVATITTMNRTNPVYEEEMQDIPLEVSQQFIKWYEDRSQEITIK